jgi:ArsR family transcriptional regulator
VLSVVGWWSSAQVAVALNGRCVRSLHKSVVWAVPRLGAREITSRRRAALPLAAGPETGANGRFAGVTSAITLREVERLSEELAALAEPHRLLILRHLRRGRRTVDFLARACEMTQPLTSHHLAVLLKAGLVTRERRGSFSCYAADARRVREVHRRLGRLTGAEGAVAEAAVRLSDNPC